MASFVIGILRPFPKPFAKGEFRERGEIRPSEGGVFVPRDPRGISKFDGKKDPEADLTIEKRRHPRNLSNYRFRNFELIASKIGGGSAGGL